MGLVGTVESKRIVVACSDNATPIERDGWTFAHEGRIEDVALLRPRISQRRILQISDDTDRSSFFAFLLSSIDAVGSADAGLVRATNEIRSSGARGNFDFVLANETSLYAHRSGRSPLVVGVESTVVVLADGALIRVDRGPPAAWRMLAGSVETDVSGPELPFTD